MPSGIGQYDTMVLGNDTPAWHKTGLVVPGDIKAADLLRLAGLDWLVDMVGPLTVRYQGKELTVDNYYATVKTGPEPRVLGVVSEGFVPIQNYQQVDFLQALVDSGEVVFDTAGSLFNQRVIWTLMKSPEHITIGGHENESVQLYLLAKNGHGAGYGAPATSFQILPTLVRVVCNNTLQWALGSARSIFTVPHRGDVFNHIQAARDALKIGFKFQESIVAEAERLVEQRITADEVDAFLKQLVRPEPARTPDKREQNEARAERQRDRIAGYLAETPDLAPIRETRYGLLQAVSGYEAHARRFVSNKNRSADERRMQIQFGIDDGGSSLTVRAGKLLAEAEHVGGSLLDRQVADALKSF